MSKIKIINTKIRCPECESIEDAEVILAFPWSSFIHDCKNCGYTIMESEWDVVIEESNKL